MPPTVPVWDRCVLGGPEASGLLHAGRDPPIGKKQHHQDCRKMLEVKRETEGAPAVHHVPLLTPRVTA